MEGERNSSRRRSDAPWQEKVLGIDDPARPAGRGRRRSVFWLRLIAALVILGVIFERIDLATATIRVTPRLVAATLVSALLLLLSQGVAAMRWSIILAEGRLRWGYLFRLYVIGAFFSLFLPTSVGGDAVRAAAVARASSRPGHAMASVLVDRAFGVAATIVYAGLGLIVAREWVSVARGARLQWHWPGPTILALVVVSIGVVTVLLRRSSRASIMFDEGVAGLRELMRSPVRLGEATALAMVSQGLIIVLWYTLSRGVGFGLPVTTFLWAVPVVGLSALLPLTFSGLGVREGAWLVLLGGSAIPRADIVIFSLLYFVCTVAVGSLGGIVLATTGLSPAPTRRAPAARSGV